jgi:hypothetical protein
MRMPDKPRHRSGYRVEGLEQVKATCLTVAATLGAYVNDLCIVGGLVPALLIDTARTEGDDQDERHPGTNDLDIGLGLALLNDKRYAEISARLRAEGFRPDTNFNGNPTVQRWRLGNLRVTVDFLIPPAPGYASTLRIQNLQPDFGALITPGLELAFDESVDIQLYGYTLKGERITRTIPVCGPAAFAVLKALAFGQRGEPKDAYDLVYVIRHTAGRGRAIAERLVRHAERHGRVVNQALALLARDFDEPDSLGPRRAADFIVARPGDHGELDDASADAHGYVDDLLISCRTLGLIR